MKHKQQAQTISPACTCAKEAKQTKMEVCFTQFRRNGKESPEDTSLTDH